MMNVNVEDQDNFKAIDGIGLYKIRYEMDVKNVANPKNYIAGVIAYSSKEAIDTLVEFAQKRVSGFKGLKIETVSFDGLCHAISDKVKNEVINTAKNDGIVIDKAKYDADIKKASSIKKSIIPKD